MKCLVTGNPGSNSRVQFEPLNIKQLVIPPTTPLMASHGTSSRSGLMQKRRRSSQDQHTMANDLTQLQLRDNLDPNSDSNESHEPLISSINPHNDEYFLAMKLKRPLHNFNMKDKQHIIRGSY